MNTDDAPFHLFVLIACLYLTAILITNNIYYYRLWHDGGAANISASTSLALLILNFIALIVVLLKLCWVIYRIVEKETKI